MGGPSTAQKVWRCTPWRSQADWVSAPPGRRSRSWFRMTRNARRWAVRATALFTPDATPVKRGSADESAAAVIGAEIGADCGERGVDRRDLLRCSRPRE